jgi:prepilin-type N-terminal cleavage/methylation domain-containing protein
MCGAHPREGREGRPNPTLSAIMKTRTLLKGFTLIELLIVVAIIATLSSVVFSAVRHAREAAYLAQAKKELRSVHDSLGFYMDENGEYPPDSNRDIPPGLEQYLAPGIWPDAAWPGSVFDWDNWDDPETGEKIYQISIRFCPIGEPDECRFPNQDWAEDFDISSSVFYCIEGRCRAHRSQPSDHPGYCVNCREPQYPYGIF